MTNELLHGAAFVTFVRSTMAHAQILSIDTTDAGELAGVLAVLTSHDLDLGEMPLELPMLREEMRRPLLARDTVRFVGEPIAIVVTERPQIGADAADWSSSTTTRSHP